VAVTSRLSGPYTSSGCVSKTRRVWRECLCAWTNGPSTSSEYSSKSNGPCTRMKERKCRVGSLYTFSPLCALPELLDNVQALNRVARAFKQDECVWTR